MMTDKEKMLSGKLYLASDEELRQDRLRARKLTWLFNQTMEEQMDYRRQLLTELFGYAGKNIHVNPTFRCDYGYNIKVGDNFYANYDCIILDICKVEIGNNVLLGPRVSLFTASHPIDSQVRATGLECGRPIVIGDDVWIGGSTIVNPGVTIGDRTIIGAGSIVTHDLPDDVIAAGNPCRVLRPLTEEDRRYWVQMQEAYGPLE